jgi:uncharacterized membrane protein
MRQPAREYRQIAVLGSLLFLSALCVLLYILRVRRFGGFVHPSLMWNLFLAWLPMLGSLAAYNLERRHGNGLIVAACALVWLMFFPNAPYLLTDLTSLHPRSVPFWYDLMMFAAFAWTGTLLGLVSLFLMQLLVRKKAGRAASWLFAGGALLLSGFGVYLGHVPRWNSWDVFTSPLGLFSDIWYRLSHPVANAQMFAFTGIFAVFLLCVYLVLFAVVWFQLDPQRG